MFFTLFFQSRLDCQFTATAFSMLTKEGENSYYYKRSSTGHFSGFNCCVYMLNLELLMCLCSVQISFLLNTLQHRRHALQKQTAHHCGRNKLLHRVSAVESPGGYRGENYISRTQAHFPLSSVPLWHCVIWLIRPPHRTHHIQ